MRKAKPLPETHPGGLPVLPARKMLIMEPSLAAKYAKSGMKPHGRNLPDAKIANIIKRYREGASQRTIAAEMDLSSQTVALWLDRCEAFNIVHIRRGSALQLEKLEQKLVETKARVAEKQEELIDSDLQLSRDIRAKIDMIMAELTPEKARTAKWKDLVDSLAKLVEKDRLLQNKSTSNAQSVVQYITQLNTMPMADRQKMAQARLVGGKKALPPPVPKDEEPDDTEDED